VTDLCSAGDYRWHAATVTSVGEEEITARLHPIPGSGPEKVTFSLTVGGHISWRPEERRMVFSVGGIPNPVQGNAKLGEIRVTFSNNEPDPNGVVGWVYERNYRSVTMQRLADDAKHRQS